MATMTPASRPPVFNLPNQLTAARFVLAMVLFVLIACRAVGRGAWSSSPSPPSPTGSTATSPASKASPARWAASRSAGGQGADLRRLHLPAAVRRRRDGWLTPWMVTVVVARELIITGLRSSWKRTGRASAPTGWASSRWACSAPP